MSHPDEGLIHAWLDGELDPAEAARVEALVASDADWAAAAAEARGLIAASARIVGALDRVPANVIPNAAPAATRPTSRRWVWQAAAVLALMAGSAVMLERQPPELQAPKPDAAAATAQPAAPAPQSAPIDSHARSAGAPKVKQQQQTADAKAAVAKKTRDATSELANAKPAEPALDKDVTSAGARAANAPMAALAQSFAPEKLTRLQPSCFVQREPADSASRIIRLSAAALADSIRLETLVLRGGGDTLAAVNGRFTAVRVRCPEP
jgi:hypothetical protein